MDHSFRQYAIKYSYIIEDNFNNSTSLAGIIT